MTLKRLIARTAARTAAGADQTYSEHVGRAARVPFPPATGTPATPVSLHVIPCAHEGDIITPCHSCGSEKRHVRDCSIHGTCTRIDAGKDVDQVCERCSRYEPRRSRTAESAEKFAAWPPPPPPLPPL